jgi:serine/threonine protein kinase
VKISDLGLARFFESGEHAELTLKGCCLGTPEFMALEQAEDAASADARSDIYSLGATLFHLLTAELPVDGSSQYQRLQRLLSEPPRPLADAMPSAPEALASVVDTMRSRFPHERPHTAADVITLLKPFANEQTAASPPRWDGRRKAALIMSVLQGDMDLPEAAARNGLNLADLERWRRRFLEGAEQALDSAFSDDQSLADEIRELHSTVAKQAVKIEKLKAKLEEGK